MNIDISIILAVLSSLLAFIAVIQTYRFNKFQKEVTVKQGVFKSSNIKIRIWNCTDITSFIIGLPFRDKEIFEILLEFTVVNSGDKTAEDVEIFIRVPKHLYPPDAVKISIENTHIKNANISSHEFRENYVSHVISMKNIHPKQPIGIPFPLLLKEATFFTKNIKAVTKDNYNISYNVWLPLAYIFDIIVIQKDYKAISKRIDLRVIDTSEVSLKDTIIKYNKSINKNNSKEKMSFFDKFKNIFYKNNNGKHIAILDVKKRELFKTKENQNTKRTEYSIKEVPSKSLSIAMGYEDSKGIICPALDVGFNK